MSHLRANIFLARLRQGKERIQLDPPLKRSLQLKEVMYYYQVELAMFHLLLNILL
jgi:hypothetical protein